MSKKKVLFLDTETTGTDPTKNEIVQFAAIIEVDGVPVQAINLKCQPTRWDEIEDEALEVTGTTREELKERMEPAKMHKAIKETLLKHVDQYDSGDKLWPAGHNVGFDLDFLQAFWKQHGTPEDAKYGTGSLQNWRALDTRALGNVMLIEGLIDVPDLKLKTLCDCFGIVLDNAHDALADIKATRALYHAMTSKLMGL